MLQINSLDRFAQIFASVGWFIPPYIPFGVLDDLAADIVSARGNYTQNSLEKKLAKIYEPNFLSAMVIHRYRKAPVLRDFAKTIEEAFEAHFLGLDSVAVAGLVPIVEGAGSRLAESRGVKQHKRTEVTLDALAVDCAKESKEKRIGEFEEVASMMKSFSHWAKSFLYIPSGQLQFDHGTNRHAISHGKLSDDELGRPISFFKLVSAINFLTFISSFRANLSWMSPSSSSESFVLSERFRWLISIRNPIN